MENEMCNLQKVDRLDQLTESYLECDEIAIIEASNAKYISYKDFNIRVREISQQLQEIGVCVGDNVALCVPKSIDAIVIAFAVMRCGGAYVPLDPSLPLERTRTIFSICTPRFVIASETFNIDNIYYKYNLCLSNELHLFSILGGKLCSGTGNQIAYVIFTSGSTGKPKGVQISHLAALSFLRSAQVRVQYELPLIFLNVSPFFFDASILDIYLTLALGGQLVLSPKIILPNQVNSYIEKYRVTDTLMVSSLLKLLLGRFSDLHKRDISTLRSIWYGAEPCEVSVLKKLKKIAPQLKLIHGYGPTETTHTTMMYVTSDVDDYEDTYLPIGTPLDTIDIRVVDSNLEQVPLGEVGELLVSGLQLMDGYLNSEEMNCKAFVKIEKNIYYRTHDLVKLIHTNEYLFVGRLDDAVKIQGHLVYLSELESMVLRIPFIQDAVAYCYDDKYNMRFLGLIFVSECNWGRGELIEELAQNLPQYMLPSSVAQVSPADRELLPSGKLNRKKMIQDFGFTIFPNLS